MWRYAFLALSLGVVVLVGCGHGGEVPLAPNSVGEGPIRSQRDLDAFGSAHDGPFVIEDDLSIIAPLLDNVEELRDLVRVEGNFIIKNKQIF